MDTLSSAFRERYARELYHCSGCDYCVDAVWAERGIEHVCATHEHHDRAAGLTARGFVEAARALADGVALDGDALAARAYTCTTCGNCETLCPLGLHPAGILRGLRAELVAAGHVPAAVAAVRERLLAHGNPAGAPRAARRAWTAGAALAEHGPIALFAGCAASHDCPAEARATANLLAALGAPAAALASGGPCCGAPLAELGFEQDSERLGEALAAELRRSGGERDLVVLGGACTRRLRGLGLEARGLAGWLAAALAEGRVQLAVTSPVPPFWLQPSCQYKEAGDGEGPALRAVLAHLGLEPRNGATAGRHALCCGAAGGMADTAPAAAASMVAGVLGPLPDDALVLAPDPRCAAHLAASAGARTVLGLAGFLERFCTVGGGENGP